jgi:NAD-dependent SIR2 family protein deacetylase
MQEVELAWEHTDQAELAIVLGSSLKVGPACDMPVKVAKNGGKLVIINLQHTPFDSRAALVLIQLFFFSLSFCMKIVVNLCY